MAWFIKGALGGGYGGTANAEWQESDAQNFDQAMIDAEELARQEYEGYEGSNGLFNYDEYMEENPDATEQDADEEREQDIDSWIDYEAKEFNSLEEANEW